MKSTATLALAGFAAVLAAVVGALLLLTPNAHEPRAGSVPPLAEPAPLAAPELAPSPTDRLVTAALPTQPLQLGPAPPSDPVAGLPPEQLLTGTLTDARGQPVAGAWIAWRAERFPAPKERWPLYGQVRDHDRPVPWPAPQLRIQQSDAAGRFALRRQAGHLRVQHPDHAVALVEVSVGAASLDLTLDDGVVLVGDVTGVPPGAVLTLSGASGFVSTPTRALREHRERLPTDGSYRLTGLPRGRVDVRVLGPDGVPLSSARLKLWPDTQNRFDIDLLGRRPIQVQLTGKAAERAEELVLEGPSAGRPAPLAEVRPGVWTGAVDWTGRTLLRGQLTGLFPREGVLGELELQAGQARYVVPLRTTQLVVHVASPSWPKLPRVSLQRLAPPSSVSRTLAPGTQRLVFDDVPPGRYLVASTDATGFAHTALLRISGTDERLAVVLGDRVRRTDVRVVDGWGRPRDGVQVELRVGGERMQTRISRDDGRLTFTYSPPGPFPVTLVPYLRVRPAPGARLGTTSVPQEPVLLRAGQADGDEVTLVVDGGD